MKKAIFLLFVFSLLVYPMEVKLSGYSKFRFNWDELQLLKIIFPPKM